jgi:hypothetical protein
VYEQISNGTFFFQSAIAWQRAQSLLDQNGTYAIACASLMDS